jgi:hypothetical protein
MDAIEFNKTLSGSFDKLNWSTRKILTECRNMGFEKHTTVKLLHCSLNSINEDSIQYSKEVSEMLALELTEKQQ